MGLDMYLYAEKHFTNSSDEFVAQFPQYAKERAQYEATMSGSGMHTLPNPEYGGVTVSKCVGYWRKANAIHGWFVNNLADGEDKCQRIRVSAEDLITLRDSCNRALSSRDGVVAPARSVEEYVSHALATTVLEAEVGESEYSDLEPTEGFFFGSTEKDEWYYDSLEYTRDLIDELLVATNGGEIYEFYYQASW